jgi:murein hydrolase activator
MDMLNIRDTGFLKYAALAFAIATSGLACPLHGHAEPVVPTVEDRRKSTLSELDVLLSEAAVSDKRAQELASEINSLKKDETTITAALIQSAKTERKLSQDILPIEDRLTEYRDQEDAIKLSLHARRAVLAEVLAALQRMGLNPPPAILVKPQDALSSVRSAILLGAVVPELRSETEILLADIDSLKKVTQSIAAERARLLVALRIQAEEKIRLDQLVEEKKQLLGRSEQALKAEQDRIEAISKKAKTLKELIAGIDSEMAAEAKRADEERKKAEAAVAKGDDPGTVITPQTTRITPSASFASLKGSLSFPVSGRISGFFGKDDGEGGLLQGYRLATKPGGRVIAPVDARVLFADTFRSYGNLLILDAGEGYHLVMSGMNRLDVARSQFVLAGEPVGLMGEKVSREKSADNVATEGLSLYIEFRKDGKPVDSGPWWAGGPMGRTNNDT